MKLVTILLFLSSISIVKGMKPNIHFTFLNISVVKRSLQIFYKIDPYRGSSNPVVIDKTVDILMIDYFSQKQKTIAAKKIFFYNRSTGALITDASMLEKPGSDGIKLIFSFQLRSSFKKISKYLEGLDMMLHAKIFVIKTNSKSDLIKSNEILKELKIYTEMDAYLKICTKSFNDLESDCENLLEFCKNDENIIFLCWMLFIIVMAVIQAIVIILHIYFNKYPGKCSCKCSKRVT